MIKSSEVGIEVCTLVCVDKPLSMLSMFCTSATFSTISLCCFYRQTTTPNKLITHLIASSSDPLLGPMSTQFTEVSL